jgi:integrase
LTTKRPTSTLHLLSTREVQAALDGDHTDGGGLMLRVRGQSASWVLRYTAATGRRREMGLGVARRASTAQAGESLMSARKLARDARDLLQAGVDPIDDRDGRREAAKRAEVEAKQVSRRAALTLARTARGYHEKVIEPSRSAKHAAQWISTLETHVPPELWNAPVDSITAPMLLDPLLRLQRSIPETASRVRQRLDAVFEDAIFHGACVTNPAAAIRRKLREAVTKRERGSFAALPYREAPAFLARVREAEGIAARCLELAALTAARTGEVLGAEPREFDLELNQWVVPAERMKGGEAHVVHLCTRAVDVVKGQLMLGSKWLFPSPLNDKRPLSNMAMLTLLKRMGVSDRTTVHGLCRSTFSTWAYETGAARPDVIEACPAHREEDRVKAAYNRAKFTDERRALMVAWSEYLAQTGDNVIPIRAA